MVGRIIGHYRIVEKLGGGGIGVVYKAEDTKLRRIVALKFLPEELAKDGQALERFHREARAASAPDHPNICTIHEIAEHEGQPFIVMEYLEGETLAARLGKWPLAEVLRRGIEIANALDCAHRSGIVHRNLKPGNIMLTKGGAKLMDFGLARATGPPPVAGAVSESPTASRPLTAEGTIIGTFQYMALGKLEGKKADARTDLWALGCVLYEMATGKRAFEGTSQASLIAAILREEPRPMSELQPLTPPALERVARRCLEKDPDERFQSARDLAFDLEGITSAGAAASTIAPGGAHTGKRLPPIAIAGIGVAAALLAAGFVLAGRLTEHRREPPTFTRLTFQRGSISTARFAPDGKSVLYSATWDGGLPEVFETRTDLSTTRSLGLPGISLQSVSRTGELALRRWAEGFAWEYGSLAVVPSSGSALRDLLEDVSCADWSPDGSTLAVVRRIGGEDRLEMPPGHVLVKTSGWFADIRVSPDSRRIAFTEHSVVNDDRGSVAVVDVAGQKTMLTSEWASVDGLAGSPGPVLPGSMT
jgi:predicted Ser/Thr protein kinase